MTDQPENNDFFFWELLKELRLSLPLPNSDSGEEGVRDAVRDLDRNGLLDRLRHLRTIFEHAGIRLDEEGEPEWTSWTITNIAGDGSWAATYEAPTAKEALEALAQDEGYASFADYCTIFGYKVTDFAVVRG